MGELDRSGPARAGLDLPDEVWSVLARFLVCEFATIGRDGAPQTWPAVPLFLPERGQVLLTTSIGFPVKAANIRRDPRVSLLWSDPTGSGLADPAAVLLQGHATVDDDVTTWSDDLARHWERVWEVQPASRWFTAPPARRLLDWYFMRLLIRVTPRRVSWWPAGDTSRAPVVHELPERPDPVRPEPVRADPVRADPVGPELERVLDRFPDAVLSGVDGDGWPVQVRCRPRYDRVHGVLRSARAPGVDIVDGPASLLWHGYDAKLARLRSFLLRGDLTSDGADRVLTPTRGRAGPGMSGPLGDVRMFHAARGRAARYLATRGLARPQVPWDRMRS